ncbi:MAG: DNA replication/repair protein RecF [Ktedonobacterales bacterium]
MRIERLRLTDFRNYAHLDLSLPAGLIVFSGRNAQGKSNILEAITLCTMSKSFRTASERELVRLGSVGHFTRVETSVVRLRDQVQVEVVVADTPPPGEGMPSPAYPAGGAGDIMPAPPAILPRKRIRVNGVPRRAMDLVGQITAVIFSPSDLDLVIGSPSERRRFLDLTLCQVHPSYCRMLSQYQKVLLQRAALLRRIRDEKEHPRALRFWDEQLAALAAPIMLERALFLERATSAAARLYEALAQAENDDESDPPRDIVTGPGDGSRGRSDPGNGSGVSAKVSGDLQLVYRPSYDGSLAVGSGPIITDLCARLGELRQREIAQGANVLGPHRDDLAFFAGGTNVATYGSRGQQRSVALALKLAELDYIEHETGDQPILLLDDVLSELDNQRRRDLLGAVRSLDQVLLTTTDPASLPSDVLAYAHVYRVRAGRVFEQS